MRILLPFLVLLSVFFSCHQPVVKDGSSSTPMGADPVTGKLPVKSMQDDLSLLWAAIKEMHPAYGIYTPADSLQRYYDTVYASLTEPLRETQFIDRVYPFLCRLRCGHTQLRHSDGYTTPTAAPREPHLPFEVLVRHHRAWVTTRQAAGLTTGDEIISMNGIPVSEIITHGYDLYCGDGYNETFKELYLSEYDGFEDVCYKYYHWVPPYRMTLRSGAGALKTVQLDSVSVLAAAGAGSQPGSGKVTDNYANWTNAQHTDYLPLRFLNGTSVALFEVKTYQYSDTVIYKEAFSQIHRRAIKNLILDLRHNTGGDIRIAAKLLSYLADSSFHIIGEMKSRIPNPAVNSFEKYFDSSRTDGFVQGFKPGTAEAGYYHIDFRPVFGLSNEALAIDTVSHFSGNLLVLIDGATFSSGAHTAAAIRAECKKAKFIGRETAGAEEGCSGGTIQHLTLPNTHIIVEFPWMRVVSVARHPVFGHGIIPEYLVEYSPEEVVDKADPDLKKALGLIKP